LPGSIRALCGHAKPRPRLSRAVVSGWVYVPYDVPISDSSLSGARRWPARRAGWRTRRTRPERQYPWPRAPAWGARPAEAGPKMEHDRFDAVTRRLCAAATRRGALGVLAGLAGLGLERTAGKQRRKKCKKKCGQCEKCVNGKCKPKADCGTKCYPNGTCAPKCGSDRNCASGCFCDFFVAHVCVKDFSSCEDVPQGCDATDTCPTGQSCIQTGCLPGLRCAPVC
jgi:hypothetical protein